MLTFPPNSYGVLALHLADALHLGRVQLVLVFGALAQDVAGALQQILHLGLGRLGQHVQLASHLAVHPADTGAQRAHRPAHALELPGVCVAPDLPGQPGGHAVVVLAQPQSVVLGRLD